VEKEQVTGKLDELKGKAKQEMGEAVHDPSLQASGILDEATGKLKQAYGNLKDAIKATDKDVKSDFNKK
jgi:uncharacterized protein YjbJ (UPF0337 family)